MNWSDERYIRVYTRDTPDWVALPWESRALFPLLLRKVDRLGTLDLGRHGARGLAPLVGLPLDVTSAGLDGLLADGCAVLAGTVLSVPNFVAAQETTASDAKRSKDYRDRLKAESSRTVSVSSRDDTDRHAAPRDDGIVTPSVLSTPSVPSVPSVPNTSVAADAPPVDAVQRVIDSFAVPSSDEQRRIANLTPEQAQQEMATLQGIVDRNFEAFGRPMFPESQVSSGGYEPRRMSDGSMATHVGENSRVVDATPPAKQSTLPGVSPVGSGVENAANGRDGALASKPKAPRKAKADGPKALALAWLAELRRLTGLSEASASESRGFLLRYYAVRQMPGRDDEALLRALRVSLRPKDTAGAWWGNRTPPNLLSDECLALAFAELESPGGTVAKPQAVVVAAPEPPRGPKTPEEIAASEASRLANRPAFMRRVDA